MAKKMSDETAPVESKVEEPASEEPASEEPVAQGESRIPNKEYNALCAEHGSIGNALALTGRRLVRAYQNDDGTVTVVFEGPFGVKE